MSLMIFFFLKINIFAVILKLRFKFKITVKLLIINERVFVQKNFLMTKIFATILKIK